MAIIDKVHVARNVLAKVPKYHSTGVAVPTMQLPNEAYAPGAHIRILFAFCQTNRKSSVHPSPKFHHLTPRASVNLSPSPCHSRSTITCVDIGQPPDHPWERTLKSPQIRDILKVLKFLIKFMCLSIILLELNSFTILDLAATESKLLSLFSNMN